MPWDTAIKNTDGNPCPVELTFWAYYMCGSILCCSFRPHTLSLLTGGLKKGCGHVSLSSPTAAERASGEKGAIVPALPASYQRGSSGALLGRMTGDRDREKGVKAGSQKRLAARRPGPRAGHFFQIVWVNLMSIQKPKVLWAVGACLSLPPLTSIPPGPGSQVPSGLSRAVLMGEDWGFPGGLCVLDPTAFLQGTRKSERTWGQKSCSSSGPVTCCLPLLLPLWTLLHGVLGRIKRLGNCS